MDKTTNWYERDIDELLDYMYEDLDQKDQYLYFRHLMEKFPDLELDWLEDMIEYMPDLIFEEKIKDIHDFVEWYERKFPNEYPESYGYFESNLCDYYLFKEDKKNLLKRINIVQKYPVEGIDVVTIPLLYQLIFHGYYDMAVHYSQNVWKTIDIDESLMGLPAFPFVQTIHLNNQQQYYEAWIAKKPYDEDALIKEAVALGYEDDSEVFGRIFHYLKTEPDIADIQRTIKTKQEEHLQALNVHFLKYMFHKHQFPFILSQLFWSFLDTDELFGKKGKSDNWFYVDVKSLDEYVAKRLNIFYSDEVETFGNVWGLNYVFEFFHHYSLLSDKDYQEMQENISYIKNELQFIKSAVLWKMMFVFNWPDADNYLPDPNEKRLFESTFDLDYDKVITKIQRYKLLYQVPERISKELKLNKKEKPSHPLFSAPKEPIINASPKIGRNDPCSCGSGKKYKKCCGANE